MLYCGYKELLSYFEEATFPVILLKTNLSVEYMNSEAESCFGQYLRKPSWENIYMNRDTVREIKHSLEKGESVVVTPPQIKDFSMLFFQPLIGTDGKTELVRLNVEIFCDLRRKLETSQICNSLYEYVHNEISDTMQSMEMSVKVLKNQEKKDSNRPYYKLLETGINKFRQGIMSFEYLYELMKRHDISKDSLFNPRIEIKQMAGSIEGVEYTDLLGDTGLVICNTQSLEITFKTLINYIQILTGNESVKIKAYESDPHFVFVISSEKYNEGFTQEYAEELKAAISIIKFKAEEQGGNLLIIDQKDSVKILYSMRKHLRSEYSMMFNQNQIQL